MRKALRRIVTTWLRESKKKKALMMKVLMSIETEAAMQARSVTMFRPRMTFRMMKPRPLTLLRKPMVIGVLRLLVDT